MNAKKTILATLFAAAFVAPLAVAPVHAQAQAHAQAQRHYSQAELDQMLAPIALYPDALLSQVLMAATYPIEVVEAARWTRANPHLQGDDAVRAVENQDWDPSVKSLVAFPQILQRMDEQLNWTESLGDAFLAQEAQIMDSVQHLRRRAQAAGNLQSSEQIYVQRQGPTILIEPASPQYVYVPYYDPLVVYGTWWWPTYRPVYWAPWPGYARPYYRSGVSAGFWWGQPIGLSVNFFFGNVDWRYRRVHVARPTAYYYRPPVYVNRTVAVERGRWQHDPHHRRGVDYRAPEVRQRFASTQFERRDTQRQDQRQEQRQDQREAQRRDQRQDQREARSPWQRQDAQPQARPEQTRPERREAREEQQGPRSDAQQRQQREQAQTVERAQRQQQQQREQAQTAERVRRDQQRQQAEAARAQQHQQREQAQTAERARRDQQRQQAEAARAQQQQQRQEQRATMPAAKALQTPRAERQEQRQERRERHGQRDERQEQRQERGQRG